MRKYIKNFSIVLLCFALIGLGYSGNEANAAMPYTDVKEGAWYSSSIADLHSQGIVFGYNNTKQFKPNQPANRGETAQFIANALDLDLNNVKDPGFTDVPKSHPHYKAIAALASEGIIGGVGNNKYNPNGKLSRVQIAKILTLAFNLEQSSAKKSKFADVNAYAERAKFPIYITFVETLVDYGITSGKTATSFAPNDSVTRAELATFLKNTLDNTDSNGDFEVISVE